MSQHTDRINNPEKIQAFVEKCQKCIDHQATESGNEKKELKLTQKQIERIDAFLSGKRR